MTSKQIFNMNLLANYLRFRGGIGMPGMPDDRPIEEPKKTDNSELEKRLEKIEANLLKINTMLAEKEFEINKYHSQK